MSWTRPRDIRDRVLKWWESGELLSGLVTGAETFPKRLPLKGPTSAEMTDRFDEVRKWISELSAVPLVRIEKRELVHRVFGANAIPREAWIDTLDDALSLIGKKREAARFASLVALTRERLPCLVGWLSRRPMRALEAADAWARLLDIVGWMLAHPRPGIYLRQLDLPGVHTKFIEAHRGLLAELFDIALPPEAIDVACTGIGGFTARYGFRNKPERIRFRVLDEHLSLFSGSRTPDIALDADSFAALSLPLQRVFITENETNFLAFPPVPGAIVVFGAGYGWSALSKARWLERCPLHYWGDIDTHGFAILDSLRSHFGHAASFLMDRETLMAHESCWGEEKEQLIRDLSRLTGPERALFDELRYDRIRPRLRLEQEMIGFTRLETALQSLCPHMVQARQISLGSTKPKSF
ncbi:MAG TPA: DUF2220 family protein [Candidatus Ozemobacteraceae bacterium]|nr:DUF2220 family protein [Candidatus Ozemobacteraceae bacterium]